MCFVWEGVNRHCVWPTVCVIDLVSQGDCSTREDAVMLGVGLCNNGFMHHGQFNSLSHRHTWKMGKRTLTRMFTSVQFVDSLYSEIENVNAFVVWLVHSISIFLLDYLILLCICSPVSPSLCHAVISWKSGHRTFAHPAPPSLWNLTDHIVVERLWF